LRTFAAMATLAALLVTGASSAHLVPGDPVHLDLEFGAYVAGEPLTLRLFVSNPTDAHASFLWRSSCTLVGSLESEGRVLAFWNPYGICRTVIVGLDVPANSSVLLHNWIFDTRPDDGCIRIDLSLYGYSVSGFAETCPGPAPPPLGRMVLVMSVPAAARSGESLGFHATARTQEGRAIEGISISAHLGDAGVGATVTGPDGVAHFSALVGEVTAASLTSLVVQASGEGWHSASRTADVLVFPALSKYLVLEASPVTGDLIRSGGVGMVYLLVRGNDGLLPPNLSVAVEPQAPLRLADLRDLGGGRYQLTLETAAANESSVATVRIVANAPGFDGGEARLDYVVSAAQTTPTEDGSHTPDEVSIVPLLAAGVAAVAMAAGATLVVSARRRRARR
jgi:hypothetical protein